MENLKEVVNGIATGHFDSITLFKENLEKYKKSLDALRDMYHCEKEKVIELRTSQGKRVYGKGNEKKAWASRLVLRLKKRPVTTRSNLKHLDLGNYYALLFQRSIGKGRLGHVKNEKYGMYDLDALINEKENRVTEEEIELLEEVVDLVNFFNKRSLFCKDALVSIAESTVVTMKSS
ncbi:hypothetical protein GCM10025767_20710 [Thalassotalea piscium]